MNKKQVNKIMQIALVVLFVLLLRILYVDIYRYLSDRFDFEAADYILAFFSNFVLVIITFAVDILVVSRTTKLYSYINNSRTRLLIDISLVLIVSSADAIVMNFHQLTNLFGNNSAGWQLLFSFMTTMLINLAIVSCANLIIFYEQSRKAIEEEKSKGVKAQFEYELLKQQLNPHFLFNSLNSLEYLIQNNEQAKATQYIHRLADVYRYLLSIKGENLVKLSEEYQFINEYISLLQVRFSDGLNITIDIEEQYLKKQVVPLGLQVLIENAIKHNVVSEKQPLTIKIFIEGNYVEVMNNKQPRYSDISTGIGLNNIDHQYFKLAEKHIIIEETDYYFAVKLPLL